MKWMGWSWEDYQQAPSDLTDRIVEYINAEHQRLEQIRSGSKSTGVRTDFHVERDASGLARVMQDKEQSTSVETVSVDAKGNKVVTKTKSDGSVVTHREKSPAESIMHAMFGPPPSWKNK